MIEYDDWQKEILEAEGNVLLVSGRQVGKSTIIAKKAGDFAVKNKGSSVLIISATERQAEELYQKILLYLTDIAPNGIKKGKERPTKKKLQLYNNSIIRCLPTGLAGTGIRGFTVNLLIADEAAFINEEVWGAVTPMLLTTAGTIILLSTPHGRTGYFWNCYNSPSFKVFHINSEKAITERKISKTWTQFQKDKAIEFLDAEKKRMSAREYAQEYMGEFVDDLIQFFPDNLIKKCMVAKRPNGIEKGKTYYLGVDIARMGDDETTLEILDRTNKQRLVQVENLVMKKTLLYEVTNRIIELNKQYDFKEIYIDDGGLGVGVFDYLLMNEQTKRKVVAVNNRSRPLNKDESSKKKILKEDLYNNLLALMERGEIYLLDDDEIFQSLKSVQYEYVNKANSLTKLRIFGNYTHICEGLIRAAWCNRDKRLNIWIR